MSINNLDNCPRCGKIYVKNFKDICPNCMKEIDTMYEKCLKYLREHRSCTIQELSDETKVSVNQITKFIREGRISIKNSPNMGYPCDSCGTIIRENQLCDPCRKRLTTDATNAAHDEKIRHEKEERDRKAAFKITDRLEHRDGER